MKTTLIVIQNDADHAQAKTLIAKLQDSCDLLQVTLGCLDRFPSPLGGLTSSAFSIFFSKAGSKGVMR